MTRFVARLIVATRRFVRDECGATLAKYALDVALIALVAGGGAAVLGTGISDVFGDIATGLNRVQVNPIAVQPYRDHQRPDGGWHDNRRWQAAGWRHNHRWQHADGAVTPGCDVEGDVGEAGVRRPYPGCRLGDLKLFAHVGQVVE